MRLTKRSSKGEHSLITMYIFYRPDARPSWHPTNSGRTMSTNIYISCLKKSVHYLIWYNFKKPESLFIISDKQYPNNLSQWNTGQNKLTRTAVLRRWHTDGWWDASDAQGSSSVPQTQATTPGKTTNVETCPAATQHHLHQSLGDSSVFNIFARSPSNW